MPVLDWTPHSCLGTGRQASSGLDLLWHQPTVEGTESLYVLHITVHEYPPTTTHHNHLAEQLGDVNAMGHTSNDPLQGMQVLLWVLLDLGTLEQVSL